MPLAIHDPNFQGPFGNTLLHSAVVSGDLDEVNRLLAHGADPHIANYDGDTPVHVAVLLGHSAIEELLGRHVSRRQAAVDQELGTGDVGRFVRSEP
jgi:ankyrin repeat protein